MSDFDDVETRPHLDDGEGLGLETRDVAEDDADENYEPEDIEGNASEDYAYELVEVAEEESDFEYVDDGDTRWALPLRRKKSIWERAYRNRMLTQAEAYAKVFPKLKWIYCGQWPMGFRYRHGEDGVVREEAYLLSEERYECRSFLNKTFWIDE